MGDYGRDTVIDNQTVCEDCLIKYSICGDSIVDPIRGEECDSPINQVNGNVYCTEDCNNGIANECVYDTSYSSCVCDDPNDPLNGFMIETIIPIQDEKPIGYLGGCNDETTNTLP